MIATLCSCVQVSIIELEGTLRAPVGPWLSQVVRTRVDRGERRILLDLARLTAIDAAGIGELVRALNVAAAAGGVLWIAQPRPRVRRLLHLAGLVGILTAGESSATLSVRTG
jgi:anti-sigma B factor antagonist